MSDIGRRKFAPVYILMGEEEYYLDVIAGALEDSVLREDERDFNLTTLYGAETRVDIVVSAAQRFPMMAERQLVLFKEAQAMPRAKEQLEKMAAYMAHPNLSTVLVVIYKGDNLNVTSKMVKAAQANGAVVFRSPALRDYQLAGPIKDYCAGRNITIDDKAISMLSDNIGARLSKLFGEIDKLIVSQRGELKRITPDLIERYTGISKDYNPFELVNALGAGDYPKAFRIAEYFRKNPKQNPLVMVGSAVFNYFSRLVIANAAKDRSDAGLMQALQLKSPYALKEVRSAMRRYDLRRSMAAVHAVREFDCRIKGIGSVTNEHSLLRDLIFKILTA